MRFLRPLLVLAGIVLLGGCTSPTTSLSLEAKPQVIQSTERYKREYVLAPGDQVEVVVYGVPELSRGVFIRSDGYLTLPVLDDVKAIGLTPAELDRLLTERLATRLKDPQVTVIVTNPREPMVYVFGEVGHPSAVPLRAARTAAQAIALAGGTHKTGALDKVAVIRLAEDGRLTAYMVEDHDAGQPALYMALQNMALQADDLIVVPEGNRSQFVRAVNDLINTPLTGVNQLLLPYFQFRILDQVD